MTGVLHLFDGSVIIDLTLFDAALRMDHTNRGRVSKDKTGVDAVTGKYLYHYNNLEYSRNSERVRNLEAVYNLLDNPR